MDIETSTTSSENPVHMSAHLHTFFYRMDKDNPGLNFLPVVNEEIKAKASLVFEDVVQQAESPNYNYRSPEEALKGMFHHKEFPLALNINIIPQYSSPDLAESAWRNIRSISQSTDLLTLKESELWTETREDKYNGKAKDLPTNLGKDFTLTAYETKLGSWIFILSIKGIEGVQMVIDNHSETKA